MRSRVTASRICIPRLRVLLRRRLIIVHDLFLENILHFLAASRVLPVEQSFHLS